jgi:hypothetical protein
MSKKRTVSELVQSDEVESKCKEITAWMESLLGEKMPKPSLRENLLDGVYLCKLVNVLVPNSLRKYHKKPKMLAMKMENIGFFLATCKTRLDLPPDLMFQPTDLHDDSPDSDSMRKVLNVLSFLQGDADEPKPEDAEPESKVEPPAPVVQTPAPVTKPEPAKPQVVEKPAAKPAQTNTATTTERKGGDRLETDWYLHDQRSQYVDIQDEVLSVILNTSNSELSVDSKRKLLRKLQAQISFVEDKILSSNDDQLRTLAHSMGLGESMEEIPKSKGREWLVDFIIKYGRAH